MLALRQYDVEDSALARHTLCPYSALVLGYYAAAQRQAYSGAFVGILAMQAF